MLTVALKTHLTDSNCQKLVLGCAEPDDLADIPKKLQLDEDCLDRITILDAMMSPADLIVQQMALPDVLFSEVFRSSATSTARVDGDFTTDG